MKKKQFGKITYEKLDYKPKTVDYHYLLMLRSISESVEKYVDWLSVHVVVVLQLLLSMSIQTRVGQVVAVWLGWQAWSALPYQLAAVG